MKFKTSINPESNTLPTGFYYISQDNYYIANLNKPNAEKPEKYLYSDSATSCIIIIVEGKDKDNNPIIALAHLSRLERFQNFFQIVESTFVGSCNIFAQGANPPQPATKNNTTDYTSLNNTQTVISWINQNIFIPQDGASAPVWFFEECTLALGQGNPRIDDRGCYGIDLTTMTVSNQPYKLTEEMRDPTGGVQVLFCVFGLKVNPKIVLPLSTQGFTSEQITLLVEKANDENWTDILYMTNDEVLNKYSSTPAYEVPWFYYSLRTSAQFVKNHTK